MRFAKEELGFPYNAKTTCYILVCTDGTIKQVQHTKTDFTDAYSSARNGSATLYAVWPGNWRSELFVIDDLNAFADAVGVPREDNHVHAIEWKLKNSLWICASKKEGLSLHLHIGDAQEKNSQFL